MDNNTNQKHLQEAKKSIATAIEYLEDSNVDREWDTGDLVMIGELENAKRIIGYLLAENTKEANK